MPLLFGGSVNIDNARDYARLANVDGLFIGRSAWEPELFEAIMVALDDLIR